LFAHPQTSILAVLPNTTGLCLSTEAWSIPRPPLPFSLFFSFSLTHQRSRSPSLLPHGILSHAIIYNLLCVCVSDTP
jgi:hypothetical protein